MGSPAQALIAELARQERSVSWLARKAGVSVAYAWRMVNGERPITAEFRAAAAAVLGVPVDLLFPGEEVQS